MKGVIICIGNRFVREDSAGCAVLAVLLDMQPLPPHVELIEGGMAGLNLLPYLERGGRVVFVDAVNGFAGPGEIVLLNRKEIISTFEAGPFDHEAGLAYLLSVLPRVGEGVPPEEIVLVGLEGECPAKTIERAARLSVLIAAQGLKDKDIG